MAKLKDRVQNALDEARMLVLGTELLIGFHYRSAFESGFDQIPPHSRALMMAALGCLLIAMIMLMSPGAYHRIVEQGEDSESLHGFATTIFPWFARSSRGLPFFASGFCCPSTSRSAAGRRTRPSTV